MRMRSLMLCVGIASMAGCWNVKEPLPQLETVYVDRAVAVSCIKDYPVAPIYMTGKGVAPSSVEKGAILIRDFEAAEQYGIAWEAAAAGCRTLPSKLPPVAAPTRPP